jgi:hypothetical protein
LKTDASGGYIFVATWTSCCKVTLWRVSMNVRMTNSLCFKDPTAQVYHLMLQPNTSVAAHGSTVAMAAAIHRMTVSMESLYHDIGARRRQPESVLPSTCSINDMSNLHYVGAIMQGFHGSRGLRRVHGRYTWRTSLTLTNHRSWCDSSSAGDRTRQGTQHS